MQKSLCTPTKTQPQVYNYQGRDLKQKYFNARHPATFVVAVDEPLVN
jgi:hypothetical protein